MNFIFDVLIPRGDIDKLGLVEQVIEWGGEVLSQAPPRYTYKSKLVFQEHIYTYYYQGMIEKKIDVSEYIALTLDETLLSELEVIVNQNKKKIEDNHIVVFLRELHEKINKFYIFLLRDEECIDKEYIVNDVNKLIEIFINSLRWTSLEGIVLTKN